MLKFIYSEKVTKLCEISNVDLSYVVTVKSTVEISQNCVAFSEYMNFKWLNLKASCFQELLWICHIFIYMNQIIFQNLNFCILVIFNVAHHAKCGLLAITSLWAFKTPSIFKQISVIFSSSFRKINWFIFLRTWGKHQCFLSKRYL